MGSRHLNEVELRVLERELKAEEEAKKARKALEAGEDPEMSNVINDFIAQCDDPNYFRTVYNKITGQKVVLSDEDLDMITRIRKAVYPNANYDPYEPYVDFFSNEVSIHPVMNRPEPKAAFVPSLSEKRALTKLVALIRSGRLKPYKPPKREKGPYKFTYDLWLKEGDLNDRRHRAHIAAPKLQLPGHAESYNPPPEYLLTTDDVKRWESQSEEERDQFFIPQRFSSLRTVPFYKHTVRERFERCLELYMCPRQRIKRAHIDPEALIPKLPRPSDLQPFPSAQSVIYKGHKGIVHSISVEPQGQFMVSGGEDNTVRFWEVLTGRCWRTIELDSPVRHVAWCPKQSVTMIAAVTSKQIYFINSLVGDSGLVDETDSVFETASELVDKSEAASRSDGESTEAYSEDSDQSDKEDDGAGKKASTKAMPKKKNRDKPLNWTFLRRDDRSSSHLYEAGARLRVDAPAIIDQFSWHPRGDYFVLVMPDARTLSVIIGHVMRRQSSYPFKRGKHLFQRAIFHPTKPRMFVADDRSVTLYDLTKKEVSKKLFSGLKTSSCMAVHPGGDNLLLGSYDPRFVWFDTDLSTKPYKTIRYHKSAIRSVCFHKRYPLFASASDDAHVIVSHGMVYDDLTQTALIVPLKTLHGHEHSDALAVTDCEFHQQQPWIFSSGSDATIRLYT